MVEQSTPHTPQSQDVLTPSSPGTSSSLGRWREIFREPHEFPGAQFQLLDFKSKPQKEEERERSWETSSPSLFREETNLRHLKVINCLYWRKTRSHQSHYHDDRNLDMCTWLSRQKISCYIGPWTILQCRKPMWVKLLTEFVTCME